MKHAWPRFEQLPRDDRLWMLVWLGPFFIDPLTPGQRFLRAVIVPLHGSEDKSRAKFHGRKFPPPESFQVEHARLVQFGVGELPALTIGMIFRQGRLLRVQWPYLRSTTLKVTFKLQTPITLQEAVEADIGANPESRTRRPSTSPSSARRLSALRRSRYARTHPQP